jgi:hypothetical protein
MVLGIGVLALTGVLAAPGQLQAQRGRGGSVRGFNPAMQARVNPNVRRTFTPGFGFTPGFNRGFFDPRLNRGRFDRFEDRFENRSGFGRFDRFEDRFENRFGFSPFDPRFGTRFVPGFGFVPSFGLPPGVVFVPGVGFVPAF